MDIKDARIRFYIYIQNKDSSFAKRNAFKSQVKNIHTCFGFWKHRKGIDIIFLVLQFSSSGGTFPVSLTPVFFQKINPFVPFTYAVSLLREAVGGIVLDIVQKDLLALLFFFVITSKLAKNAEKTKILS